MSTNKYYKKTIVNYKKDTPWIEQYHAPLSNLKHLSAEVSPITLDDIICLYFAVKRPEIMASKAAMVASFQPVFTSNRQNH